MIIRKITPNDCVCSNSHGQRGRPWPRERVVPAANACREAVGGMYCPWLLLLSSS